MTVRLRPHHLLCMLTFVGKGYTADFTENYRRIAARLSAGEDIVMVDGPDDICAPLLGETDAHCRLASVTVRDEKARAAVESVLGRPVATGSTVVPDAALLSRLRAAFASGAARTGCYDCEWSGLCTTVAASGYADVLITPRSS